MSLLDALEGEAPAAQELLPGLAPPAGMGVPSPTESIGSEAQECTPTVSHAGEDDFDLDAAAVPTAVPGAPPGAVVAGAVPQAKAQMRPAAKASAAKEAAEAAAVAQHIEKLEALREELQHEFMKVQQMMPGPERDKLIDWVEATFRKQVEKAETAWQLATGEVQQAQPETKQRVQEREYLVTKRHLDTADEKGIQYLKKRKGRWGVEYQPFEQTLCDPHKRSHPDNWPRSTRVLWEGQDWAKWDQVVWGKETDDGKLQVEDTFFLPMEMEGSDGEAVSVLVPLEDSDQRRNKKWGELKKEETEAELLERLPEPGEVPFFDERAMGSPKVWSRAGSSMYWGSELANRHFTPVDDAFVDLATVMSFFWRRPVASGQPVAALLGDPDPKYRGWVRFPWAAFSEDALPAQTPGAWGGGRADWQTAWHGCKFEALYSIMYDGRLSAEGAGIPVYKDESRDKIGFFTRFSPLCRDGVMWCAKWELRVDVSDRMQEATGERWLQHERSIRLEALWLCGRTYQEMEPGLEVSKYWDPVLESNPMQEK